jgi:hypothetical protein
MKDPSTWHAVLLECPEPLSQVVAGRVEGLEDRLQSFFGDGFHSHQRALDVGQSHRVESLAPGPFFLCRIVTEVPWQTFHVRDKASSRFDSMDVEIPAASQWKVTPLTDHDPRTVLSGTTGTVWACYVTDKTTGQDMLHKTPQKLRGR